MKATLKDKAASFSFVLPALIIFSLFYIYPFIYSFILSLTNYNMIGKFNLRESFVGLQNFKDIASDGDWWKAMYNGAFITFWALSFQNILALMLALSISQVVRMNKFYRVVFFILPILSEIVIGLLLRRLMLSEPTGHDILNHIVNNLGLGFLAQDWISGERVRLITALVHCWKGFGWAFVIFLAGLQAIPEQLYEAARIDGANAWQSFRKITLPLLMPVITLIMVITIIGTMSAFAMILALNQGAGGETTVPIMIIYNHLGTGLAGLACAEGLVLGVTLILISFTMFFVSKKVRKKYGLLPD
ncbi:MAG: sugar ABC transporter permease [Candidatus Susulua stagnicola]|nr:sugar ABC transporter permease [Candidatus Susulua stagnicola]